MKNFKTMEPVNKVSPQNRVNIVALQVDVVTIETVIRSLAELRVAGGGRVCFANVHMVMEAYDHPEFAEMINSSDLVVPDGMPLVWMQKLLGRSDSARARGNSVMTATLRRAAEIGLKVGFYGGTQAVLDEVRKRAETEFPGLLVRYAHSPPFRPLSRDEDIDVIQNINAADLDILFVSLGCPKQEIWMARHREKLSCVMLGVGATFDFFAGAIPESPQWLSQMGLEWLYRLSKEPRRLWRRYLTTNPRFVFFALRQLMRIHAKSS